MSYTELEKEKCKCGDIRLAHTETTTECIYCNCKKFQKDNSSRKLNIKLANKIVKSFAKDKLNATDVKK